jgi:hypothetical protein
VLPAGCHIELDAVARDIVLRNVRSALRMSWRDMAAELKSLGPTSLLRFLEETMLDLEDLYSDKSKGWIQLQETAGLRSPRAPGVAWPDFRRLLHVDDPERLDLIARMLRNDPRGTVSPTTQRDQRLMAMLHFALWGAGRSPSEMDAGFREVLAPDAREELRELADALDDRLPRVTHAGAIESVPLRVHARYSRDEALAAFGIPNPNSVREGVKYVESERADLFFVTLQKTEEHFSPTTMYRDRAITPALFQWESQSTTTVRSKTGQRYINHDDHGSSVHLFVRETRRTSRDMAAPYLYAGQAHYDSHRSERPIEIIWRLERELPADVYHAAKAVAG